MSLRGARAPIVFALLCAGLLGAGMLSMRGILRDPSVYLLIASDDSEWIVYPEPRSMLRRREGERRARFRVSFELDVVPAQAWLDFQMFRTGTVNLDGRTLTPSEPPIEDWKRPRRIDLAGGLRPGTHTLGFEVANWNGHPAVRAESKALGIFTGADWEVQVRDEGWRAARSAHEDPGPSPLAEQFAPTWRALLGMSPVVVPLAGLVLAVAFRSRRPQDRIRGWLPSPGELRWALIGVVALLGANNLFRLPWSVGFDVRSHIDYVDFIALNARLPLASDGWEMFQAPLYYLVTLPVALLLDAIATEDTSHSLLRIVPMLCGLAHIEVVYRMLRTTYPERGDVQCFGLVVGALLPMNLLLSQMIGNETTSALLTGLTLLLALRLVVDEAGSPLSAAACAGLGAVWGLALLTKSSALALAPILVLVISYRASTLGGSIGGRVRASARGVGALLGVAFVIAGWFYLRNWLELGNPLQLGWGSASSTAWWQDPGYRTPEEFWRFGTALVRPFNAVHHGLWDGFYSTLFADGYLSARIRFEGRPPWNYGFMLSGVLLALVPTATMLLGAIASLRLPRTRADRAGLLALLSLGVYVAAMLYFYLRVPNYSITKASYTAGLASCYGILAARGYAIADRSALACGMMWAGLVVWAVSAWASFFVVGL